jgi:aspartyl-tRNA(Asn)/glutamyl-tRNA(Gln) amidotransferase subunit B
VGITRVHMEEDAGKSLHHGFADSDRAAYLDFNRAGVPLIEIVTEPDMRSAADAATCFTRLRDLVLALEINDGNMEEGSLRCDANVSLRPVGQRELGVKAEVKNVNSFRYLQKASRVRDRAADGSVELGGRVIQETRLWDSERGETFSMRSKEEARDYRYFPEPDLPPVVIRAEQLAAIRASLPELPDDREARFVSQYGLSAYDADVLVRLMPGAARYFESTGRRGRVSQGRQQLDPGRDSPEAERGGAGRPGGAPLSPERLAGLIAEIESGRISTSVAKSVFETMWSSARTARENR